MSDEDEDLEEQLEEQEDQDAGDLDGAGVVDLAGWMSKFSDPKTLEDVELIQKKSLFFYKVVLPRWDAQLLALNRRLARIEAKLGIPPEGPRKEAPKK